MDTPTGGTDAPVPADDGTVHPDEAERHGRISRASERVRTEQARVNAAVDTTRERLEQARPKSVWVDIGFRAYEHDTSAGGAVIAGAVAFRLFLFLVPYVFVAVVAFGFASEAVDEDAGSLAREAGIGGLVAKAVAGAADLTGFERATALAVGLFALYFGAKGLLKVLRVSYGMIWNVRPSKLKKTTIPALVVIGLTTIALICAALVGSLRHEGLLLAILGFTLTTGVPFGVALVAAWYLPRRARTWQELAPGAVLVAVGVQLLHLVTVFWIAHVLESKTDTYGAIGAALAILLWAYLLGRLITAAAVIDATMWLRHREVDPDQDVAHTTPEGNP